MDDHLGYGKHDPAGRDGGNSRNGHRAKTVHDRGRAGGDLGAAGPGFQLRAENRREAAAAADRRRGNGACRCPRKGLTHGEISAHLQEIYGAEVSKQTITAITDRVIDGMAEWQSRPLDPVYAVVFIDAIQVKIRDGQVANRPVYLAIGRHPGRGAGHPGLVGRGHGDGEGAKFWMQRPDRDQEPRHPRRPHAGLRRAERATRRREHASGRTDRADVRRPPAAEHVQVRLEKGLGGGREGRQADLHRGVRSRRAGRARRNSPGNGRSAILRLSGSGRTPGPSSSRSWGSTTRSARSSAHDEPDRYLEPS